jgi:hypothetical protein
VTVLTRIKLALTIMALVFFVAGMRTNEEWQRWVGIGLLALAVALRFVDRSRAPRN